MPEKEILHFKIGLSGSSPIKQPKIQIKVSNKEYVSTMLTKNANETEYFEFDAAIEEGSNFLEIVFENKANQDTILDQKGNIVSDLLLNIDSIEIAEIDLGPLKWTASIYKPDYPKSYIQHCESNGQTLLTELRECVNLGWNGQWILPFTSPFYVWLLENI
jgi:hypothetical protein